MPDAFTRLGGSQYVNSPAVGRYADYVVPGAPPAGRRTRYPESLRPGAASWRAESSGGFGALHLGDGATPGRLPAPCASISGDCGFEACFGGEILAAMRGLVAHDMDPSSFLEAFASDPSLSGDDHAVLLVLAMSAAYSPNPATPLGYDLPMDLETGERVMEVWERWLAFDPIVAAPRHADALRSLELLHLECGLRDEFHLQWGLRVLLRTLRDLDVPFDHEEHPKGHMDINERYAPLMSKLARVLG